MMPDQERQNSKLGFPPRAQIRCNHAGSRKEPAIQRQALQKTVCNIG
jgi:hypothetical protein